MDPIDYQGFVALNTLDPDGRMRDDIHNAMQLAQVANLHRRKHAPAMPVEKFLFKGARRSNKDKLSRLKNQIRRQIKRQQARDAKR